MKFEIVGKDFVIDGKPTKIVSGAVHYFRNLPDTWDDIFTKLVQLVYRKDTPTNIFPSIHVYNSIACCVAILKNERCRSRKWVTTGTVILTILIIVSTVMIKQHSVVDLVGALVLNMVVYGVVYGKKFVYWFKRRGAVS